MYAQQEESNYRFSFDFGGCAILKNISASFAFPFPVTKRNEMKLAIRTSRPLSIS